MKLFFCFLILLPALCHAQSADNQRPKIGLALSGGGARGLAHLGVLKVLEEEGIPIDMISGTSMGAVVGGFFAVGWSTQEIIDHFQKTNFSELFVDHPARSEVSLDRKDRFERYVVSLPISNRKIRLPTGLVEGQKLSSYCADFVWPAAAQRDFLKLPIPLMIMSTDLVSGEPFRLTSGVLTQAIRASMSIPSVFYPVRMQSRLLVDGMLVRNFPVEDLREMGADLVIGVDVGSGFFKEDELQSILEVVDQAMSFQSSKDNDRQRSLSDFLILPRLDGLSRSNFSRVSEWVQRGEIRAREILPRLKEKLAAMGVKSPKKARDPIRIEPVYIDQIQVKGLETVPESWAKREMNLKLPGFFTREIIGKSIDRLYRSLFFRTVSYYLQGSQLMVLVSEKEPGTVSFGIRYDSDTRTEVLINSSLRHVGKFQSRSFIDLVLGNQNRAELENFFFYQTGVSNFTGLRSRTYYEEEKPHWFSAATTHSQGEMPLKKVGTEFLLGSVLDHNNGSGIGIRAEKNWIDEEPFLRVQQKQQKLFEAFAILMVDSLNQTYFPTRGTFFTAQVELADKEFNSDADYLRKTLVYQKYFPLRNHQSIILGTKHGAVHGDLIPFYRKFALGGFGPFRTMHSLPGFHRFIRGGDFLQAFHVGFQHQQNTSTYLGLDFYAGRISMNSSGILEFGEMIKSTVLSLKRKTRVGPAQIQLSYNSFDHFLTHFSLGYHF